MERQRMNRKSLKNLCMGSGIALVLSVILLLGFSILLVNTDIQESTTRPIIILLSSVCILIGSMFTAKKNQKNGIVNGGMVGGIYLLVLWILSSIFIDGMGFTMQTAIMLLAAILTGMLGRNFRGKFCQNKVNNLVKILLFLWI